VRSTVGFRQWKLNQYTLSNFRTLQNYVTWLALKMMSEALPKRVQDVYGEFREVHTHTHTHSLSLSLSACLSSNNILSVCLYLRKVGGLFPNELYNVTGFSLSPIKTDRLHITEKLLSMAKNSKRSIN
jgi:hypothetical protein